MLDVVEREYVPKLHEHRVCAEAPRAHRVQDAGQSDDE
jgi:hypothetical protein